jgi:hypothetical protein
VSLGSEFLSGGASTPASVAGALAGGFVLPPAAPPKARPA